MGTTTVVAFLFSLLTALAWAEIDAICHHLSRWLLALAVKILVALRLSQDSVKRAEAEWLEFHNSIKSPTFRLLNALSLVIYGALRTWYVLRHSDIPLSSKAEGAALPPGYFVDWCGEAVVRLVNLQDHIRFEMQVFQPTSEDKLVRRPATLSFIDSAHGAINLDFRFDCHGNAVAQIPKTSAVLNAMRMYFSLAVDERVGSSPNCPMSRKNVFNGVFDNQAASQTEHRYEPLELRGWKNRQRPSCDGSCAPR